MRNLISNSLKFTLSGGCVNVNIRVIDDVTNIKPITNSIKAVSSNSQNMSKMYLLCISVEDNGVGISPVSCYIIYIYYKYIKYVYIFYSFRKIKNVYLKK